jgi:thiol:disulfide interchange protein DsbC
MRPLTFALLGALSLSACAQGPAPTATAAKPGAQAKATATAQTGYAAGTPEARVQAALHQINPQVKVDRISKAPIAGFHEAIVGGQVVYVSDDGKYLLQGTLYDIANRENLGEASLAKLRRELLKSIPVRDRIVFAPPNPKHTVAVFTDVECGYCRKMHSEIAEYNRQGIAVQYLAFPRMGLGSEDFRKMVAVWCAADPKAALTAAKNDRAVPMKNCTNPVTMQYDIGQRAGLTGTPMILAEDGSQLGGYLPPAQLRAALDKLVAGKAAKPAGASDPVARSAAAK